MGTTRHIDLNADLGEGYGPWRMGDDAAMLALVTSANVACGGHAGDPETMFATVRLAVERGVAIGAHPSYPDLAGFGRRRLPHAPAEVERFVASQIGSLAAVAALAGGRVTYVKPHGALANVAAVEAAVADAILNAVRAVDAGQAVLAISGTVLEQRARARGIAVFSEVFADRGYTPAGNLVPRDQPGALIDDVEEAASRLAGFMASGEMPTVGGAPVTLAADSICVHGDSPHAVAMARIVRERLAAEGIAVEPFITG